MDKLSRRLFNNFSYESLLVSKPLNIFYLTGFDGFSKEEREAYLFLTKRKKYIFTDARYLEAVAKNLQGFEIVEISSERKFKEALEEIIVKEKIKKLAIDVDDIKASEFLRIKEIIKVCSDENIIEKLREVKENYEVLQIKKACGLGDLTFKYILSKIKIGATEKEIAKRIELFILSKEASVSFAPIVAFGKNSSSPHHVASNKKLKKSEIVLLDFGVKINNYCSDMTRTVFMGKATLEQKNIYKTVLEAQEKAIEYIVLHKNAYYKNIDKTSRDYILSKDFSSIPHSLGHGIGLEVHEAPHLSPSSNSKIKKNTVFSIEPGIYIPGFGGVRIEDLVFYDGKNPQLISRAEKQIIEL
jgi:Xaa-Pro aminopeptidase